MLDAAADKAATLGSLFWALARPDAFPPVPLWLPVAPLALDGVLAGIWIRVTGRAGIHPPSEHVPVARVATLLLFLLVGGLTLGMPSGAVLAGGGAAVALRVWAAVRYVRVWIR